MIESIDIRNFLPHRNPMLMVDLITEISDRSVSSIFKIKADNIFVSDSVFQEVGLIENAAQTCSAIVGQTFFVDYEQGNKQAFTVLGFISSIKKVEIYALPAVNEEIETKGVLVSRMDGEEYSICVIEVSSYSKGEKLVNAEINLFLQKQKNERV